MVLKGVDIVNTLEIKDDIVELFLPEDVFVYFLTDEENEVLYVGRTENGLSRPLIHKYDKEFDKVFIKHVDIGWLNILEDYYITKYKPLYNRSLMNSECYKLERVRNEFRKIFKQDKLTVIGVRELVDKYQKEILTFGKFDYLHIDDIIDVAKKEVV